MAKGLPNTDPALGRLNKSSEESVELQKKIKEEGMDTSEATNEQLALIASFTEVMKNYIPKLGFIDAHTQALKLKQDAAFKVLEKIEGHLAKQAEQVGEGDEESDADAVDPEEETLGPQAEAAEEASEDTREDDGTPLERIAEDVHAIREAVAAGVGPSGEEAEDLREQADPLGLDPSAPDDDGGGGGAPKKTKKLGAIGKFLKKIGKLFSVFNLIIVGILAVLLTANADIFSKLKELFGTIFKMFTQIVGLVIEKVLPAVTQIFGVIIDLVNQLLPPLMDIFSVIIDVFMQLVDALIPPLMAIVDMVVPVIISVVDALVPIIMSIMDALMPIIEMILDVLMPIVQIVLDLFMFLFETILLPIFELLTPIVEFVGNLIMGFFNGLIAMWNGLIEAVAWLADFFGKGDEVREMKMDPIEKDESKEQSKLIDWSQDDETIDAQIQAKVDSGEMNEKTAEKLRANKKKHREDAEKRRQEAVERFDIKEETIESPDGEPIKLISMDLSDVSKGVIKKVMFDPESMDEHGNYQFYNPSGQPVDLSGHPLRSSFNMMANAAKESLKPIEPSEGEGGMDFAALLGVDESTIGQDLGDDSLDTADAQAEADAAGKDGGTTNNTQTVIGGSQTSSSNKTIIMEDASSGSPQDGRGFVAVPN